MTFEDALKFVLEHEGGYSNDPLDTGGETNFGISKRAYPDEDIKNMTPERASFLYKRDYWDLCRCGDIPGFLGFFVFDSAVNQGPGVAIRILQESLGVTVDGVIGPKTLEAAKSATLKGTGITFVSRRCQRYAINPQLARFGLGWFRRVADGLYFAAKTP